MSKENIFKNGGFPPIKYCKVADSKESATKTSKERFFSNATVNVLNIRQILKNKSKIDTDFIIDKKEEETLEIV
jgi:hypothetical protein